MPRYCSTRTCGNGAVAIQEVSRFEHKRTVLRGAACGERRASASLVSGAPPFGNHCDKIFTAIIHCSVLMLKDHCFKKIVIHCCDFSAHGFETVRSAAIVSCRSVTVFFNRVPNTCLAVD